MFPLFLRGPAVDNGANTLSRVKRTADIRLSAADLTANSAYVASSGAGTGVRAQQGRNSGKIYFEFSSGTAGTVAGNPIQYGVCTAAAVIGTNPTDAAYIQNFSSFLRIECNGSNFGAANLASLPSTSGIIGVAIDFSAALIWLKSYNSSGTVAKQWNVGLNGDPAAGSGGVSIAGLTSATLYPFIAMRTSASGGAAGFIGTFNPTSTVVNSPPSGFTAGW